MKAEPISICMIGKNEEFFLEKTLKAAWAFLTQMAKGSELVFVDTGSADRTKEIAGRYTDRVFDFAWCDDFSDARNYSLDKAKNDLVFSLDCDEVILPCDAGEIQQILAVYGDYLGNVTIRSRTMDGRGGETASEDTIRRVFRKSIYRFKGIIHEQILPIRPQELQEYFLPLVLDHYGYLGTVFDQKKKNERNIRLLEKAVEKEPEDPYHHVQLGQSYRALKEYEKAVVCYEKAMQLGILPEMPYAQETLIGYGKSLLALGKPEEAGEMLSRYYPDYFTCSDLYCLSGDIYCYTGEPVKAMLEYINAILCPVHYQEGMNSWLPYFQIGYLYEQLGKPEEAIGNFRKCGDYAPALEHLKALGAD